MANTQAVIAQAYSAFFTIANGLIERMDIGESQPALGHDHAS